MEKTYLGVDIGGTKCSVVVGAAGDGDIRVLNKASFPTRTEMGLENTLRNLLEAADGVIRGGGLAPADISAFGVSCGGPLDSRTGRILSPPNLYGWDDVPIAQILEERFGVKTYLQNDANACALAEWKFGAAKGLSNVVFLTFGTGMGAGLILNGKLYDGTNGMAGEVGHIRLSEHGPVGYGKEGSFEGFCSGAGIAQLARTKALEKLQAGGCTGYCKAFSELEGITAKTVADAADAGDRDAAGVYAECAEYLGRGLSVLIDILNPEMIVIGSIYARSENLLAEKTLASVARESLAVSARCCRIVPAQLGNRIGDVAAVSVAVSGDRGELNAT